MQIENKYLEFNLFNLLKFLVKGHSTKKPSPAGDGFSQLKLLITLK